MGTQNEHEGIIKSFSGFQMNQKWITVIANIFLMLGEVIFVALLAYVVLNLSSNVVTHIGIPGLLISGSLMSIGLIMEKSQEHQ